MAKDVEIVGKTPSPKVQPFKASDTMIPIKGTSKENKNKKSFSKKTAQEAGAEYTKQKARNAANKGNKKSNTPNLLKGVGKFHRGITGSGTVFSPASPNIIFTAGIGLIIASGISSKRIPQIFRDSLSPQDALAHDPQRLWRNLKITFVQVGFIFGITILSRMFPGISWFFLIVIGGTWLLWLMRNPELLFLLSEISQDGTTSQQGSISTLAAQLNNTPISPSNLYPGSIFPQNPNTTAPQTSVQPNPLAPNAIYQNVLKALKGSGGGSRGVR